MSAQLEEEEAVGSAVVARVAAAEQAILDCARHVFGKCDCPGSDAGQIYCAMMMQQALDPFVETVIGGACDAPEFEFRLRNTADRSTTAVYGDNADTLQLLARSYRVHVSDIIDRAVRHLLDEAVCAEGVCETAHEIRRLLGMPAAPSPRPTTNSSYNISIPRKSP